MDYSSVDYSMALENITVCKLSRAVTENCQLPSYTLFSFLYSKAPTWWTVLHPVNQRQIFLVPRSETIKRGVPLHHRRTPQIHNWSSSSRGSYIALVLLSDNIKPKKLLCNCTTTQNLYFDPIQLPTSRGVGQKSDQERGKRTN